MQVNPEDSPPELFVTWSDPRMTDFENCQWRIQEWCGCVSEYPLATGCGSGVPGTSPRNISKTDANSVFWDHFCVSISFFWRNSSFAIKAHVWRVHETDFFLHRGDPCARQLFFSWSGGSSNGLLNFLRKQNQVMLFLNHFQPIAWGFFCLFFLSSIYFNYLQSSPELEGLYY